MEQGGQDLHLTVGQDKIAQHLNRALELMREQGMDKEPMPNGYSCLSMFFMSFLFKCEEIYQKYKKHKSKEHKNIESFLADLE